MAPLSPLAAMRFELPMSVTDFQSTGAPDAFGGAN
jgi:hypothetical protein